MTDSVLKFRPRDAKGRWVKVQPPQVWRPARGGSLTGSFAGIVTREGPYGPYKAAVIHVKRRRYVIGGAHLINTLEWEGFEKGDAISITFLGTEETRNGHMMKMFDVYYKEIDE